MHIRLHASRHALAICALSALPVLGMPVQAFAASTTVGSGQTVTAVQTIGGTDTLTVQSGGTLQTTASTAITQSGSATGVVVTNSGTIATTGNGGRAFNASGSDNARTITITNNSGGVITSQDDAIRVNVNPTGGTITVNNSGTISTTNGGQAIDFNAITGTGATVVINNNAGGSMTSVNADAVRPGQGATVNNAGTIMSSGTTPGDSNDGVDWQGATGTVNNLNGGTISGQRHGVTADNDLTVNNVAGGTIIGRNGSGVGSDGNGTVVNAGTITGRWDGVAPNGDGDGVDIDFIGSVTNSGIIQGVSAHGVDSGGQPNSAEGIAMGGGTIVNNQGGQIIGGGTGILIDNGSAGSGYGATTITNAGLIIGQTGPAIKFVGNFDDSITNSGTITGNGGSGGTAIDMGAGNDRLTLLPTSVINGTADGGGGTDSLILAGTGNATLTGSFVNFEQLSIASGSWEINGALTGMATTVNSGATLRGVGSFGALTVASGGTIAPGTGIGTITVNGGFVQSAGSTYQADVAVNGTSDRIVVVGGKATIQTGATLAIQPAGTLKAGTRYVVLTADGGVTGTYTTLTSGSSTLELREGSTANSIFVDVARTGASLGGVAQTFNQAGVARGLGGLTAANAAYAAITLLPADESVRGALDLLSGEIHGSLRTAAIHDAANVQHAVIGRIDDKSEGHGVWGQFTLGSGEDHGRFGAANDRRTSRGGIGGVDVAVGSTFRAGIAGGYNYDRLSVDARASSATLKTVNVMGYVGGTLSGVAVRGGIGYAWVDVWTDRTVNFAGFLDRLNASYNAHVAHGFVELGVPVAFMGGTVEPFGGLSYYHVSTDAFTETGGAAALRGEKKGDGNFISTAGLRVQAPVTNGLFARGKVAWQHAFEELAGNADLAFISGGSTFNVRGAPLSHDAALVSAGLVWQASKQVGLSLGYDGEIGSQGSDNVGRATLSVGF